MTDSSSTVLEDDTESGTEQNRTEQNRTEQKKLAAILALFLGAFGVHKFYMEKFVDAAGYLLSFWTPIPLFRGIIDIFELFF